MSLPKRAEPQEYDSQEPSEPPSSQAAMPANDDSRSADSSASNGIQSGAALLPSTESKRNHTRSVEKLQEMKPSAESGTAAAVEQKAALARRKGGAPQSLRSALEFVREGIRDINTTASLVPSSRYLVRAMMENTPLEEATCVVELGPGVGTLTGALLERLSPQAHIHAIELSEALVKVMKENLPDPRLQAIHGDATQLREIVRGCGCQQADVVFSSLGLSMMPDPIRDTILEAASGILGPDAPFVQYNYLHTYLGFWCEGRGWTRYNGWSTLGALFDEVESRTVWRNIPPATVFHCTRPKA